MKDTNKMPASPKLRRFEIKGGAAALLYARGYRWTCLSCGKAQLEDGCQEIVACRACLVRFIVEAVHHVAGRQPLSQGTAPQRLFGPAPLQEAEEDYTLPLEDKPVHLSAIGYQWICVECDPWCELPRHTRTALVDQVCCNRCHAEYAVAEVRHWRGLPLSHKELTRHALRLHLVDEDEPVSIPTLQPAAHQARVGAIL